MVPAVKQLLLLGSLAALTGCDLLPKKEIDAESALVLPTKDDVALIDGRPLSLGALLAIRSSAPRLDRETLLWVGLAATVLQNDGRAKGRELSPLTAVNLAKFAMGLLPRDQITQEIKDYQGAQAVPPDSTTFKAEVDSLLSRAVIRRNEHALAEIR